MMRRQLFIPSSWAAQGRDQAGHPLVQRIRAAVDAGDAQGGREAFEEVLRPLEAALARGEQLAAEAVPPPYAWKLYFACLSAVSAHAHRMSDVLDTMQRLGVPPQPACYVIALRQMARQGKAGPAYTKIAEMKELGMNPTLKCYISAVQACLAGDPPFHNYAKKLLDEVVQAGLAEYPSQRTELGKLIMHSTREMARYQRFIWAVELLDLLEVLDLHVPAFLTADVMHLATLAERNDALLQCVRRLERCTQTFQEVPGVGEPVTRPLKVEEGLLLAALEVAANKGDAELAEAAWRLLERSVALPNPPSTSAALSIHLGRAAAMQQQQQQEQQGQEGEAEEAEEAAAGAGEDAAAARGSGQWERLGDELEALDAAAAEAAEASASRQMRRGGQRTRGAQCSEAAAAEAAAMAAQQRGVRAPSVHSHLALIHAYGRAGRLAAMLEAVARLQQAFPEDAAAAAYHAGLPMAMDAVARSEEACDEAYYVLEGWAREGRPVAAEQLNLVVAACCQIGDLKRAFDTFDAYGSLGVAPNADSYNALIQGCVESGHVDAAMQVLSQMREAGVEPNAHTHQQLVEACIVSADVPGMMQALEEMQAAGHTPKLALMERCVARAEREGAREEVRALMRLLLSNNDYRIVGVDAKMRRWVPEGGMQQLTGSGSWFSREEVLRELRKGHSIAKRIARREGYAAAGLPDDELEGALEAQQQ